MATPDELGFQYLCVHAFDYECNSEECAAMLLAAQSNPRVTIHLDELPAEVQIHQEVTSRFRKLIHT